VTIATFFINYADEVAGYSDAKSANLLSVAQAIFTIGRFFCTFCMKWIKPQYILATFITILIILSAFASKVGGTAGVVLYMLLFFFERFPTRVLKLIAIAYVSPQYSAWESLDWDDTQKGELD
jgi:MFS transporter, FHS family, L-fucose permease